MKIYRNICKKYSEIQDEDYYNDVEKNREEDIKSESRRTVGRAIGLGTAGLAGGLLISIGHMKKSISRKRTPSIISPFIPIVTTAGGITGAIIKGKRNKEKINKHHNNEIGRYDNASESDKEYLRHRMENDTKDRAANRRTRKITNSINGVSNSIMFKP